VDAYILFKETKVGAGIEKEVVPFGGFERTVLNEIGFF
jgi:hypothetical protein